MQCNSHSTCQLILGALCKATPQGKRRLHWMSAVQTPPCAHRHHLTLLPSFLIYCGPGCQWGLWGALARVNRLDQVSVRLHVAAPGNRSARFRVGMVYTTWRFLFAMLYGIMRWSFLVQCGGVIDSSGRRSPGVALQRSGAAHGPLHPIVVFSKLCCLCACFVLAILGR